MSTLRINNIEAKSVPASPTLDEKIKLTNSSGDVLVHIDGKTSGITTIGINTTASNITFDANSNVVVTGIITATKFVGTIEGSVSGDLSIADKIIHSGDANTSIRFPANDTITLETGGSEIVRIDSAGYVGINDSAAEVRFHVRETTGDGSSRTLAMFQKNHTSTSLSGNMASNGYPHALILENQDTSSDQGLSSLCFSKYTSGSQSQAVIAGISESAGNMALTFNTESSNSIGERLRIASNGQVCVGNGHVGGGGQLIIRGVGVNNYAVLDNQYVGTPSSGTTLSQIRFTANTTGSSVIGGARIQAAADAAWSTSGDAPTRLQFYTAPDGSASQQERMRIDRNGIITKPYHPMLSMTVSSNLLSGNYMTHNTVLTNNGNHYNTSTSKFVCPVAGFYYASIMVMSNNSNTVMDLELHINGSNANNILVPYQAATGGQYNQVSGSCILQCAANAELQFKLNSGSIYSGRHSNITFALFA